MFIYDWISSILAYFGFTRKAKLLLIGLDNAGKSTLLDIISTNRLVQHSPTNYARAQELTMGKITFTAYDLGGHPNARRVWRQYFPAVDGIVFMVDSADPDRFKEASAELDSLLRDEMIKDIPVAIIANKTDKRAAVGEKQLVDDLGLSIYRTGKEIVKRSELPSRPLEVFPCSLLKREGYGAAFRWLAAYIE